MAELVFYTNPQSRGRIARWMLEETGAAYRTEILQYGTSMKAPAFLAVNPMGKVPTIVHDGVVVTESAAICAYLADAFPEAGLAPDVRSSQRGTYYRWLFFAAGPLEQAVTSKALNLLAPEDKAAMAGYGTYGSTMDALENAVREGPYVLGDRFSAADVYVGSQISWGLMFGTIEKRPTFEAYAARLQQRPAAQKAWALDEEAVKDAGPVPGA